MASKNIKGITIEIGGDSTELNNALKQPEKQAQKLTTELREVEKALKFNPDSVELLAQKSTILGGQVAATTDKLLLLRNATKQVQEQAARGEIGEEQYRAFQREVLQTESRLESLRSELGTTDSHINTLNGDVKSAAASAAVFEQELDKVEKELQETQQQTKNAEKDLTTLKVAFGNLVADGIRIAVDALKDFTKQGIEYISSLTEVQNVIDTVFGSDGAQRVEDWASTSIEAFGLSELTAKQYASTLGTIIDAMGVAGEKNVDMSTTLTQLSADWASFRDMKPDEVFKKMQSAITGETEAIKSLGIVMTVSNLEHYALSQGVQKAYKSMTEAEKVTLRYNFILNASNKVMGDFTKTSDSFHNQQTLLEEQMKSLSGEFAENFLPVLTEALQTVNKYITENGDVLANLGSILGTVINALVTLLSVLSAVPPELVAMIGMIALAVKAYSSINTGLGKWAAATKGMSSTLDPFTVKIIALIGALTLLLFLILAIKEGTAGATRAINQAANVKVPDTPSVPGYASGTSHARRGAALVGEDGPELVLFKGGESVIPARQTARALSASGAQTGTAQNYYDMRTVYVDHIDDFEAMRQDWVSQQQRSRKQ